MRLAASFGYQNMLQQNTHLWINDLRTLMSNFDI